MALPYVIDSLDAVSEAVRGEYTEKDGKFHLNVEGLPEVEDTTGLKTALQKERGSRAQLEKQIKSWQGLGKSPEEIQELLAAREEDERKKAEAAGDHQKILKQHQDQWAKREKELADELNAARSSERSAIVGERLLSALARAGVTEEGTELLPDRLANRIKFETVDGKRVLKIMAADGETPMAGSGPDGSATLDDLAKEATTKYPSLFKGSGAGGGGKQPDHKAGGAGVTKKSDFKTERERAQWVEKHGFEAYQALAA